MPHHVLVHAGDRSRLDVEPGLPAHVAVKTILNRLAEFEDAAGWFRVAVVRALDEQCPGCGHQ